jgi:hypothetical protein
MVASVHLRWIAWRTAAFANDPVATGAKVEFWSGEVREVGPQFVDGGLDFLELGGGRGSGIVGYK